MIKIDKGIAVPSPHVRETIYPFDQLEVGDSFAVPNDKTRAARQAMHAAHVKNNGRRFISRKIDDKAYRFWRMA